MYDFKTKKKRVHMTQVPPIQTYNKGHNSEVRHAISLIIELDLDFISINIHRKFGEDSIKTVTVRERKRKV